TEHGAVGELGQRIVQGPVRQALLDVDAVGSGTDDVSGGGEELTIAPAKRDRDRRVGDLDRSTVWVELDGVGGDLEDRGDDLAPALQESAGSALLYGRLCKRGDCLLRAVGPDGVIVHPHPPL